MGGSSRSSWMQPGVSDTRWSPSWRADHMPYGGIRDSGNTREGPAYTVREMTEERLIVIQA